MSILNNGKIYDVILDGIGAVECVWDNDIGDFYYNECIEEEHIILCNFINDQYDILAIIDNNSDDTDHVQELIYAVNDWKLSINMLAGISGHDINDLIGHRGGYLRSIYDIISKMQK